MKRVLVGIAALLLATGTAQATEGDTMLTLACQGTATDLPVQDGAKPDTVSMGIIVNLTKKIVHGFDDAVPFFGFKSEPAKVTGISETKIAFESESKAEESFTREKHQRGEIDRVTGDVWVWEYSLSGENAMSMSREYSLKCKPAQKMF